MMLSLAIDASEEDEITTSLSGIVFFDENGNGLIETTDWAIMDAAIALTKEGGEDTTWTTYTKKDGTYKFDDLTPGTYSIKLLTPCPEPGFVILGQLYDSEGHEVPDAGKTNEDGFYDIVLEDGYQGINYFFGEYSYPAGAVSKRLLIEGGPDPVPEPASLALLAIAVLILGVYVRRRA